MLADRLVPDGTIPVRYRAAPGGPVQPVDSPFVLALCHAGAERWLKDEVARTRPDLHPGFQRPGLVTFKSTGEPVRADALPTAVFARLWACSAGPCRDDDAIVDVVRKVDAEVVRVSAREVGEFGDAPPAVVEAAEAEAAAVSARLRARGLPVFDPTPGARVRVGAWVVEVITSPGEPAMVGWFKARTGMVAGPGGRPIVAPPDVVASRAWAKVAEALSWGRITLGEADRVFEIGASPGGGTAVFLATGARVTAVDAQPLDPRVAALPRLTRVEMAVGDVRFEQLPMDVTWIACDANIPPVHVLPALGRLVPRWARTLKGLLFTVKLVDDRVVRELPELAGRLRELGFTSVRATHLPANRRDMTIVATR